MAILRVLPTTPMSTSSRYLSVSPSIGCLRNRLCFMAKTSLSSGHLVPLCKNLGSSHSWPETTAQTIVGLQFRVDPLLVKVRELLQSGTIGKVTSSVVWGTSNAVVDKGFPLDAAYFLDMKSGGKDFYIHFGHCECDRWWENMCGS